ncbi:MAG: hypothetical protein ACJ73E_03695 [Mycobacteriales bacterium]
MDFLLVHPPLLGPAVWAPCAAELTEAGHRAIVPDLRAACDPPAGWPLRAAAAATAGVTGPMVVAGHSGAGVLLPLVADRLGVGTAAVVFVDALVPAATGATAPSERFHAFLDELPLTAGRLPRWTEWWGPDALAELVPDAGLRAAIAAEAPRLPRAFYAEPVPVPASWPPARVAYLQLSPAYDADAAEAAARGWPVRTLPGRHLDLVSRPAEVAAAITALAGP